MHLDHFRVGGQLGIKESKSEPMIINHINHINHTAFFSSESQKIYTYNNKEMAGITWSIVLLTTAVISAFLFVQPISALTPQQSVYHTSIVSLSLLVS